MQYRYLLSFIALACLNINHAYCDSNSEQRPIETFILEPVMLENISIWIPAEKLGPVINPYTCGKPFNVKDLSALATTVNHTKTKFCPNEVARLLAEHTACYYEQKVPLTIFNGWQWEYSYDLGQFEMTSCVIAGKGSYFENSWEVILTQTIGTADFQWLQVDPTKKSVIANQSENQKSDIKIITFSSKRTRNGYPKEKKL